MRERGWDLMSRTLNRLHLCYMQEHAVKHRSMEEFDWISAQSSRCLGCGETPWGLSAFFLLCGLQGVSSSNL